MNTHITKTCSVAFYHLYNIRGIRKYLSKETTEILIHAFISSRVDYCNSLYYGLPAYQLMKLQIIQNAAARLVFQESKYCHITPILRDLHWHPVKYRIDYKILLLTIKQRSKYSLRSFYSAVPRLWNSLPCFIRDCLFVNNLKNMIKSFLYFGELFPIF